MNSTENCPYQEKPWLKSYAPGISHKLNNNIPETFPEFLSKATAKYYKNNAFSLCLENGINQTLTFEEVDKYSNAFAAFLTHELGLKKGTRVAVQLPNCLAYPLVVFGILKSGCVLVNTNPLYTTEEMIHQFNDANVNTLVIIDMFCDKLPEVISKTSVRTVVRTSVVDLFPPLKKHLVKTVLKLKKKVPPCQVATIGFEKALKLGENRIKGSQPWKNDSKELRENSDIHISANDVAALQYTGGTTGVSKGAELTHKNLLSNAYQVITYAETTLGHGEEIILTALPLYHIFAFSVNLMSFFGTGNHNVMVPTPRPLTSLKPVFEKWEITWTTGVNTLFAGLVKEEWFRKNPPKSLKTSIAGGMALHPTVAEDWQKITNSPVIEGYGLTEASPVIAFNPIGGGTIKANSIGIPLPDTDIKIVDREDPAKTAALGEPGELLVRGPQVMRGYLGREEETKKTFHKEWLCTGDIATMDEEGFLKIVDRKKEMVIVSGFNVYPNEIEEVLSRHPKVLESGVIGVPDAKSGETVMAYVVRKDETLTPDALRQHCREHLTNYKVPKYIEFEKELPKSAVGKILRKDLRVLYKSRFTN